MSSTSSTTTSISSPSKIGNSPPLELESLRRLSDHLSLSFLSPDSFSDSSISTNSTNLSIHRCILAARSPFFRKFFAIRHRSNPEAVPVEITLRELVGDVEVGTEALVAVLGYLYSGKVAPLGELACGCVDERCLHEACRVVVEFAAEVMWVACRFEVWELVSLFQRHLLDVVNKVAIDDLHVVLSAAYLCKDSCIKLSNKCIDIVVHSNLDVVTLEKKLPPDIVQQVMDLRLSLGLVSPENKGYPDKHVRRIHRALDSDDVELLRMLLKEGSATLDDAYALHYAVAHCDSKITTELLDLELADVNHRDPRGYTVLHIAAMRKEPKIIVSLLTKGARPSDVTLDGRKALDISKRLAKYVDYHKSTEEGKATPKDRLCIEILEQAERKAPQLGEASVSLAMAGDDLRLRLLYLENRVALARVMFPTEAKLAMEIAQVDGTLEFTLCSTANHSCNQTRAMDLNETPFKLNEEHLARIRALSRTVQLGKFFFPRCSNVLDKIMDDDLTELTCLGQDSTKEKKRRYMELQDVLSKAFNEDKEEFHRSGLPSSSASMARLRK